MTEPFIHSHSETAAYDEYKTADGKTRVTVVTEDGQFKLLTVRVQVTVEGTDKTTFIEFECLSLDEIEQLLTALHAAVAGIHKKGSIHGTKQTD